MAYIAFIEQYIYLGLYIRTEVYKDTAYLQADL